MPESGINFEDISAKLESIAGEGAAADAPERKRRSFDTELKHIKKKDEPIYRETLGIAKKIKRAESKIKKEVAEKETIPPHSQLIEIHNSSLTTDKLKMDYGLIQRAFELNGNAAEREPGQAYSELKLDGLVEMQPTRVKWDEVRQRAITERKPQIMFRQVNEIKGLFNKRVQNTGEVLVLISLGNSNQPEENTVVTMLVRHEGGKLIWGDGHPGLYGIRSEAELIEGLNKSEKEATLDDKLCRGKLTTKKYLSDYQNINWKSLYRHQEEQDREVVQEPDVKNPHAGEIRTKRTELANRRAELLEGLSGEYSKRLQEVQKLGYEVVERANQKIEELTTKYLEIVRNQSFKKLLQLMESGEAGPSFDAFLDAVAKQLNMDANDLKGYLEREADL